jgi:hypothetical protein
MNRIMGQVQRVVVLVAVAMMALVATDARAQQDIGDTLPRGEMSLDQLRSQIYVTDAKGKEVKGTLLSLGTDAVVVMVGTQPTTVPWDDVALIQQRGDGSGDGVLQGLGIGLGLALISFSQSGWCRWSPDCLLLYSTPPALVGAATGWALDALVVGRTTVYKAPKPSRKVKSKVSLSTISREGVAARWQLRW